MIIQLHTFSGSTEYRQELYEFLVKVEGKRYDSHLVKGIPHIGIGFNFTENPALDAIISVFGINPNRTGLSDIRGRHRAGPA